MGAQRQGALAPQLPRSTRSPEKPPSTPENRFLWCLAGEFAAMSHEFAAISHEFAAMSQSRSSLLTPQKMRFLKSHGVDASKKSFYRPCGV